MLKGRARKSGVLAALAFLVVLVLIFSGPISRALVAGTIDVATGERVAFTDLDLTSDRAVVRHLDVAHAGRTLLTADRAMVRYRFRDLFPGGSRRFGLVGVELNAPRLFLERRADGTFDVAPGAGGPAATAPVASGPVAEAPLRFDARIRDGSIVLEDQFRVLPESRRLGLEGIAATIAFDSAAVSTYQVRASVSNDAPAGLSMIGRIDAPRGFAIHRIRAHDLALVPIVNYFINSTAARFESGVARSADIRVYGFASGPSGTFVYHTSGSLALHGGGMRIPGLVPSASDMDGKLDVFDGGFAAPALTARLGALPVRVAGGLYDWASLKFRLGIAIADAPLKVVRGLFAFSRTLPLEGPGRLTTYLEGPVALPLVSTRVSSPALTYAGYPVDRLAARAIYYDGALDVVGLGARYGGLEVAANGAVDLGETAHTKLVFDVRGPAARVPYLAELAPDAAIDAAGVLAGDALRFDVRGAASGAGGGTDLAAIFHENAHGDGRYGPFRLTRSDGSSVVGAFTFDRSANESAFWLDARHYRYAELLRPAILPGIDLAAPTFHGLLDGQLAGVGPPSDFRIAGNVRGHDLRVGGLAIAQASGHLTGRVGNFGLRDVIASGPWGRFSGRGAYVGPALALDGIYHGSFAQLRTFTGEIGGTGPVNGPVALLIGPTDAIVQARGALTPGAIVRGVPVDAVSGTVAVSGKRLRVYAATGSVASGTLVAAGDLDSTGVLGVSLAGAQARRLRAVVPLGGGGDVAAIGTFGLTDHASRFDGGLALGVGATLDRLPLVANGDVTLAGTRFDFHHTDAEFGSALGTLDGSLGGVGTRAPFYDARLHIGAARLGPLVRSVFPERRDVAGSLTGDLTFRGSITNLAVAGMLGVPEGTVNGLSFRDASARIALLPGELSARRGTVTVGSTTAAFGADVRGKAAAFHLDAPRANLEDFNDYFDAGDMLGGRGRIAAQFVRDATSVRTSADIAIADLRVRRFDLGDLAATWNSRGRDVTGRIAFGGASGRLETTGVLGLPADAPLDRLLTRARFTGKARLRGLDLGVWLPAVGYQVPIGGRIDADATIAGRLSNPDVRTEAALVGGSIGKFPVDRLVLSASSTLRRTTISRAELDVPNLSLVGSGSFGLGARDPIALAVHAKSPSVGSLATQIFGAGPRATGVAEADVAIDGTRVKPRIAGGFDLESATLGGVAIPRALGQFSLSGRDIVLTSVEVGFATGTLQLAGSVPLEVAPFGFGPASAPISLEVAAKGIDFVDFAPLLPVGSKLGGKLDGRVAVGGTAGAPRLVGALSLAGGTFASPLQTEPLTDLGASLAFAGTDVRLESLHAASGGGTLDASGAASVVDLVHPGADATYRFSAEAKHLRLNFPAYGGGQVDGKLAVSHVPGARPRLSGALALSEATIPFAALLSADSGGGGLGAAPAPPAVADPSDLALDLTISATNNVRVRSSNVDIGGRGNVRVAGTSSAPVLEGGFDSTGGTLTYFNTVFRLVDGRVTFTPDLGLIPTLDARAVTHVIDPDPNTVRNLSGSANVTLDLAGPVTNLTIGLTSDPAYDRQQILGLLFSAPAFGASNLFGETAGSPTLYGSTNFPGSPGSTQNRSNGGVSVAQEAFGIANAQFTRTLLAPIETSFAQAVGLSNFDVNVDYTGNVGLSARKVLGKKINAVYGTSFGYPYRQTFGFEIKPSASTAAQLTLFQTLGASGLTSLAPATFGSSNLKLQSAQPSSGTTGFSLSFQRLF